MGAYLISNCRSSTLSICFYLLLPKIHFFTFTWSGPLKLSGLVAVRAALGHTPQQGRRRMMNVPPIIAAAGITTVVGHSLEVKTSTQAFRWNGFRDNAAITLIKNTVARHVSRLLPKTANPSQVTKQIIQGCLTPSGYYNLYSTLNQIK